MMNRAHLIDQIKDNLYICNKKSKSVLVIQLFDDNGSLPQSACFEPVVVCTGFGPPGFCNRVQPVQLSTLLQPKISDRGHNVDAKGYKLQKILHVIHVSRICRLFLEAHSQLLQLNCHFEGWLQRVATYFGRCSSERHAVVLHFRCL